MNKKLFKLVWIRSFAFFAVLLLLLLIGYAVNAMDNKFRANSKTQHVLPILETVPTHGSKDFDTDYDMKILLDDKHKNFNRFRQQFENGDYEVIINGVKIDSHYDSDLKVIKLINPKLKCDMDYEVTLNLKANLHNNSNAANNASYTFSFKTDPGIFEVVSIE